jgi:aspartyl protease family protein
MIGWAILQALIWGGFAVLAYAVVGYRLFAPSDTATAAGPAASVSTRGMVPTSRAAGPNALTFRANREGHVELDAAVNGAPVYFLVDTGATMVVLSVRDAAAAGISRSSLDFSVRTQTANGIGRAAPVTLRELRVGQFSAVDVAGGGGREFAHLAARPGLSEAARQLRDARRRADPVLELSREQRGTGRVS